MSGLNLSLSAGTAPYGAQLPSSAQALLNFIAAYVGIAGSGSFNGINYGSNTPAPQNRGLPWFKTDGSGNPVGLYAWNGTAWVTVPTIVANGPTSLRPVTPSNGAEYYDTTIGGLLLWNATQGAWTTASGMVGDVKEVTAATIEVALANNPGWAQHTASNGCVIGAAADSSNGPASAHAQGTLIGEEAHVQAVSEMAAHTHTTSLANANADGNDYNIDQGLSGHNAPGAAGSTAVTSSSSGSSTAANVIQPTMYLFRLYKVY